MTYVTQSRHFTHRSTFHDVAMCAAPPHVGFQPLSMKGAQRALPEASVNAALSEGLAAVLRRPPAVEKKGCKTTPRSGRAA